MTYPLLTPPIIPTAFAEGAGTSYITNSGVLPTASQIGITNGAASLVDGFPPLNFQLPISQGGAGIPMSGQDLNAILYMITAHLQNLNAGVRYKFSSALSTLIGGYPVGAILQDNSGVNEYINVLASNTTDFNSTPASIGVSWMLYSGAAIVGSIISVSANVAPQNYLALPVASTTKLKSSYPLLDAYYSANGYPWGSGNGLPAGSGGTFNIPFIANNGSIRHGGTLGANDVGSIPSHRHQQSGAVSAGNYSAGGDNPLAGTSLSGLYTDYYGAGTQNIASGSNFLYCVKYQ